MLAERQYWPLAAADRPDVRAPAAAKPEPKPGSASYRFAAALVVAVVAHVAAALMLVAIPLRYSTERLAPQPTTVQFAFGGLAQSSEIPGALGRPVAKLFVPEPAVPIRERLALPGSGRIPATATVSPLEIIGVSAVDTHACIAATGIADSQNVSVGGPTGTGPSETGGVAGASGGTGTSGTTTGARATYLHSPRPRYPSVARHNGWEGLTILRVEVEATGQPVTVEVLQSSGHDVLDQAAVAAVRDWKFVPARAGDKPIISWLEVPIRFRLIDA